jgi:GT2 family glycosyltransferase
MFALTVVIPVSRTEDSLEAQLICLERQLSTVDAECIVVDDGCSGGIASRLAQIECGGLDIRVLRNHAPVGRSLSRNRGWMAARKRHVLFLNPGMLPASGWLDAYREATLNDLDMVLGAIQNLSPEPADQLTVGKTAHREDGRFGVRPAGRLERHPCPQMLAFYVHQLAGCNMLITRDLLEATRGFAPFLSRAANIDLGFRLAEFDPTVGIAKAVVHCSSAGLSPAWTPEEGQALLWRNPLRSVALADGRERSSAGVVSFGADFSLSDWRRFLTTAPQQGIRDSFDCRIDDIVEHLSEATGADRSAICGFIRHAVSRGLLVDSTRPRRYFSLYHTLNLLKARTLYLEYEIRNASFPRTHPTPRQRGRSAVQPVSVRCTGEYTLTLDLSRDEWSNTTTLNIALPVEHGLQAAVRLGRLTPPSLAPYVNLRHGFIANVPLALCVANGGAIGYQFECNIHEFCGTAPRSAKPGETQLHAMPGPPDLRFAYPPAYLDRALALLNYILDGSRRDEESDARRVYRWIVEHIEYAQTRLADHSILDTGIGSCVDLARLFINLVRLRGIPAREQCGALMSRSISTSEVLTVALGYSPFSHTWAEIYLNGRGWIPVEFAVIFYGKWRTNPLNVGPDLRAELAAHSEQFLDYYFGCLDPYRIHGSTAANRLPTVLDLDAIGERRIPDAAVRHRLRCSLS